MMSENKYFKLILHTRILNIHTFLLNKNNGFPAVANFQNTSIILKTSDRRAYWTFLNICELISKVAGLRKLKSILNVKQMETSSQKDPELWLKAWI